MSFARSSLNATFISQPQGDDADVAELPGASYWSMPLHMTGAEIVELRQGVGWSQAQLAARISYSQRQVSRWERGQQLVSPEACQSILRAVIASRMTTEEERLMRYQTQRWLRGLQRAASGAMSKLGLG